MRTKRMRTKRMRTRKRGGWFDFFRSSAPNVTPKEVPKTEQPTPSLLTKFSSLFTKKAVPVTSTGPTATTGPTITGGRKRYKGRNTRNKRRI